MHACDCVCVCVCVYVCVCVCECVCLCVCVCVPSPLSLFFSLSFSLFLCSARAAQLFREQSLAVKMFSEFVFQEGKAFLRAKLVPFLMEMEQSEPIEVSACDAC